MTGSDLKWSIPTRNTLVGLPIKNYLRKILKKKCEYVFVDAPHTIPETTDLGWWFSQKQSYDATEATDIDNGFEESLNVSLLVREKLVFCLF